jgi:hypothetical protein
MRASNVKPATEGDTSPRMLKRLATLPDAEMWAVVDAGPDDSVTGKFYAECYYEALRRERAAIDTQEF